MFWLALAAFAAASQPHSEAAVIAADEAWEKAELSGDTAFLADLLLHSYVSVATNGKRTTREMIISGAASRSREERQHRFQLVAEWRAKHPVVPEVTITGDMAVLRWVLPGTDKLVSSSDIFIFQGGRWHAVYSQHTAAAN